MAKLTGAIVYCPCGHSAEREQLSEGSDTCYRTLRTISPAEWVVLARSGSLALTPAGRAALEQEGGDG